MESSNLETSSEEINNVEMNNLEECNTYTYVLPFSEFQLIRSDEDFDYYICNEIQYMYHRYTGYYASVHKGLTSTRS